MQRIISISLVHRSSRSTPTAMLQRIKSLANPIDTTARWTIFCGQQRWGGKSERTLDKKEDRISQPAEQGVLRQGHHRSSGEVILRKGVIPHPPKQPQQFCLRGRELQPPPDQSCAAVAGVVEGGKGASGNKVGEQITVEVARHRPEATGAVIGAGGTGGDRRELQI